MILNYKTYCLLGIGGIGMSSIGKYLKLKGKELTIFRDRITKKGDTIEEAYIYTTKTYKSHRSPGIKYKGKTYNSIESLSEEIGISFDTLYRRIRDGEIEKLRNLDSKFS